MLTWEELERVCKSCTRCRLCETRTNVVFGMGDRTSPLMLIGEGPGEQEDLQGLPFVGRSGKLLDQYLEAVDLSRDQVYIANIVKCRPPQNRDPMPDEQDACIGFLNEQLAILKPKIIVCLGRIAAMRLIKEDFRITREHGQWFSKDGVEYTAIYHPSALLRDVSKRPETFTDLLSLRAKARSLGCQPK